MPVFTPIKAEDMPAPTVEVGRRDYVEPYMDMVEQLPEGHYLVANLDEAESRSWTKVRDGIKHRFRRVATLMGREVTFHRGTNYNVIMSFTTPYVIDVQAELEKAEVEKAAKPKKERKSAVSKLEDAIKTAQTKRQRSRRKVAVG